MCDDFIYTNSYDKGLKLHKKIKNKILQTDGANDQDLLKLKIPAPSAKTQVKYLTLVIVASGALIDLDGVVVTV